MCSRWTFQVDECVCSEDGWLSEWGRLWRIEGLLHSVIGEGEALHSLSDTPGGNKLCGSPMLP